MTRLIVCVAVFFFFSLISSLLSSAVFAQVYINEFSSSTSSDWIELYNSGTQSVQLSELRLRDSSTNKKDLSGEIVGGGFQIVTFSNWLNNSGDTVRLVRIQGEIEELIEEVSYGEAGGLCVPGNEGSIGRISDGTSSFVRFLNHTQGLSNDGAQENPCPTLTPTPSPTPTPTPTLIATYKINQAKDQSGNDLANAKIYVDSFYIHHFTPETLTFCDGCECDSGVVCNFGNHTIMIEKSGYDNWAQTKTINPGDYYEISPVMSQSNSVDPTPPPTKSSTLTPRPPTPTQKLSKATPTVSDSTKDEESLTTAEFESLSPTPTPAQNTPQVLGENAQKPSNFLPIAFIGLGVVFLGVSGTFLLMPKFKRYNNRI